MDEVLVVGEHLPHRRVVAHRGVGAVGVHRNKISLIVPSAVDGTSLSTLSVAISSTVSSCFTASPGFLCHFKIVASIILSPSFGITKSTIAIVFILVFGAVCSNTNLNFSSGFPLQVRRKPSHKSSPGFSFQSRSHSAFSFIQQ